jgi:hypothetical protein
VTSQREADSYSKYGVDTVILNRGHKCLITEISNSFQEIVDYEPAPPQNMVSPEATKIISERVRNIESGFEEYIGRLNKRAVDHLLRGFAEATDVKRMFQLGITFRLNR